MKTWLVNTNIKQNNNNPKGFQYMLRQNKVSAYYDRATTVDKINVNDLVLLYHNDNRIIAVGAVVNNSEGHDYKDLDTIEHWVDVNWLWKDNFDESKNPINPINRNVIGIKMVNNTVVNITDQVDYKKLFEEITKRQNFL
jgi:predicted Mrr-cat superfamily restriction endonuclease